MLSLELNVQKRSALKIPLPNSSFFKKIYPSCWMFRFNEPVFSMNVAVLPAYACPQSAFPWARWCLLVPGRGAGVPPCPVALAAPGHGPHPSFLLLGGSQIFLTPLRWGWQGHFGEGFMQGLAGDFCQIVSVPK